MSKMKLLKFFLCVVSWFSLAAGAARAEDIHVSAWGVVLVGAPYAVALEKGYFKAADVTGVIATRGGGGTLVRNALAGGLPFVEAAPSAAIAGIDAGLPIKIVGLGTRSYADSVWVMKKGAKPLTLQELPGKRVAITAPKSSFELQMLLLLQQAKVPSDRVTRVPVGALQSVLTAIDSGAVDIGPVVQPTWNSKRDNYQLAIRATDFLPAVPQTVLVAGTELTDKQPQRLRAILAGRRQAVDFIYANPHEAAKLLEKYFKEVKPDDLRDAVDQLAKARYWSPGALEKEPLLRAVEGMRLTGELDKAVDVMSMINTSFLPADQQQMK